MIWRELGPDIGKAVLTRNLFGMASYSEGAKIASMQELASELRSKGNLKSEVGQATIQAAQAARIMQQVLELAGSTEREAINQALKKVNIPYGDPNLYLARAEGLAFGEDRMPKDSTSMMVHKVFLSIPAMSGPAVRSTKSREHGVWVPAFAGTTC